MPPPPLSLLPDAEAQAQGAKQVAQLAADAQNPCFLAQYLNAVHVWKSK